MTNTSDAIKKLDRYMRARYPLIAIVSHEETRVMVAINSVATQRNRAVAVWSLTQGLRDVEDVSPDETQDPSAMLYVLSNMITTEGAITEPTLFVFKDMHSLMDNPMIVRYIRDIVAALETTPHTIIFVSPSFNVPNDLDKNVVIIDWPLPDERELDLIITATERELPSNVNIALNGSREKVIAALRGLTAFEAETSLLNAIAAEGELSAGVISHIVKEKSQIIRKSGVLEIVESGYKMDDIGGLQELKTYARRKLSTFSVAARDAGIEAARGVLLVGVPGTGKSLSAKAIAADTLPLLKLDMGALMTSELGGSEKNLRQVFKVLDAIGPCVLWVDEIEKALADNDGRSDGGVKMGMLGSLLTWMQEHTSPVYIVATANQANLLRPELISRFDDVLWIDLPDASARAEILAVHFSKRGHAMTEFTSSELVSMVEATWGFSGREIERQVKSALEVAFFEGRKVRASDLVNAAAESVPTAQMMKAQIDSLRSWADNGQIRNGGARLEERPKTKPVSKAKTLEL